MTSSVPRFMMSNCSLGVSMIGNDISLCSGASIAFGVSDGRPEGFHRGYVNEPAGLAGVRSSRRAGGCGGRDVRPVDGHGGRALDAHKAGFLVS